MRLPRWFSVREHDLTLDTIEEMLPICPTLNGYNAATQGIDKMIARMRLGLKRRRRLALKFLVVLLVLIVAEALVIFILPGFRKQVVEWRPDSGSLVVMSVMSISWMVIAVVQFVKIAKRLSPGGMLVLRVLETATMLEAMPESWSRHDFARTLCRQFNRCAAAMDRFGQSLYWRERAIGSKEIAERTSRISAQFREYKLWVTIPGPFTYTDLVFRLSRAVTLFVDGKWYLLDMYDGPSVPKRKEPLKNLLWTLALVLLVGTFAFVLWQQRNLGFGAAPALILLTLIIMNILSKFGVTAASLQDAAEISKRVSGR